MSRVSKKKFWEALKKEPDKKHAIFDIFNKPITQKEWLRGYKKWVEDHTLSSSLGEYEAIENISKFRKKRRKKCNKRTNSKKFHECGQSSTGHKFCQ